MEKEKSSLTEQLGNYLIDVSKLTFGGVVLSVILEISHNKLLVLAIGVTATIGMAIWGFVLLTIKNNKS